MDYARSALADALAAQYVAGTLRGRARRRFDALLPSHPALQAAVRSWQDRLMPLTGVLPPQAPPPRVWRAIEARLWPAPPAQPWWQRLGPWRVLAGTATVAVAGLAVLLASPPPAQAPVVVVLQGTGADAAVAGSIVAGLSGDGRAIVTRTLTPVSLAADRVLELWSVPPQGAPRSLGLISANGATVLPRGRLPASLLGGGTAALAVSIEPPGGSPTGAPTGPVVFAGSI
jgi:anti-sigma-K factor RskA